MTDLKCQSNYLVFALTAFAFLVSLTCLFYRPVIITRSSRVLISVCLCVNGCVVFSQFELNSCLLSRMGNFTSSAPGLSSTACNQFVQVSLFRLVCFGSIKEKFTRKLKCGLCNSRMSFRTLMSVFSVEH